MRYFPGIVLLLLAAGVWFWNSGALHEHPDEVRAINIPFLSVIPGVETRDQRGQLTWQLLAGAGGALILVAGALHLARPREERLEHDRRDDLY